jgi:hypothetical protein
MSTEFLKVLAYRGQVALPDRFEEIGSGLGTGEIRECGAEALMCLSYCISVAFTGSPNAAPLIRRLSCAALLAHFDELNGQLSRPTDTCY